MGRCEKGADLYHESRSWYLAMAGYNAGAGRIRWAIRKAGIKDYCYLPRKRLLRKETRRHALGDCQKI